MAQRLRGESEVNKRRRRMKGMDPKSMIFEIQPVTTSSSAAAAAYVREQVFAREQNLVVPPLSPRDASEELTLIAVAGTPPKPIAALTVVETSGDDHLHQRLGLVFPPGARVARFAQLAVLKPYRGLNIPVELILE